jgi:hypothetical protein
MIWKQIENFKRMEQMNFRWVVVWMAAVMIGFASREKGGRVW